MDKNAGTRKRRSKVEKEGRVHFCTCGKSYLSYQALYTHKRTKHSVPQKTEQNDNIGKRGRPKKSSETHYDPILLITNPTISEKLKNFTEFTEPVTCDEIFTEFLYEKSKIYCKKDYKRLVNSIISLRNCVNKYYEEQEHCPKFHNSEEYTVIRNSAYLPTISNVYILKYLPELNIEYDLKHEVEFLLEFCKWLEDKHYTEYELSMVP